MWPTPVGAQHCDSFSSRVTEHLSVLGLGLNSSPGQPSRKCVSFLARQSLGASERVCTSVETQTTPMFLSCCLQRCDCEGWSRLCCFSQNRPRRIGPNEHPIHVSNHLGSPNTSSTGLEHCFISSLGRAGLVTL